MNFDKSNAQDALKKITDGIDELNLAANVPRETPAEIKKLKDDNTTILITAIAFGLLFGISMMFHANNVIDNRIDNGGSYKQLYEFERDHKVSRIQHNRNRMMESYNAQMVPVLEREVKELKDNLEFEKLMSSGNKTLYKACLSMQ